MGIPTFGNSERCLKTCLWNDQADDGFKDPALPAAESFCGDQKSEVEIEERLCGEGGMLFLPTLGNDVIKLDVGVLGVGGVPTK